MSVENRKALQRFLNSRGKGLVVDGIVGPRTLAALRAAFSNPMAPAVTDRDVEHIALLLGADPVQVRAVAEVESSGGGFLRDGRPKILYERHWLWRRLRRVIPASGVAGHFIAHPSPGGYTLDADRDGQNDSWEKLEDGCRIDPVAAFESVSWGKFQIMGGHWKSLGYASVFEFAYSMVVSEAGHYHALAAFIRANGLAPALRRLSGNPATNEDFARGYNGRGFRKNAYHQKLAKAMRRLTQ